MAAAGSVPARPSRRSILDLKDLVDASDFEDLPYLSRRRAEGESSRIDPAVLVCPHECADPLRVEERHPGEVDDNVAGPGRHRLDDRSPELIGRRQVNLAYDADERTSVRV